MTQQNLDATAKPQQLRQVDGNRIIVWTRDVKAEQAAVEALPISASSSPRRSQPARRVQVAVASTFPDGGATWLDFVHHDVPALHAPAAGASRSIPAFDTE